jgi:hypothetical protein
MIVSHYRNFLVAAVCQIDMTVISVKLSE